MSDTKVTKDNLQEFAEQFHAKNKTLYAEKAVEETIDGIQTDVAAIKQAYGTPLVAATAAAMTDQTKIYVYTGTETGYTAGNWYYYNGSAWTSGGTYNSTAFTTDTTLEILGAAADAKTTGDEISGLKDALSGDPLSELDGWVAYNGTWLNDASYVNKYFAVKQGDVLTVVKNATKNAYVHFLSGVPSPVLYGPVNYAPDTTQITISSNDPQEIIVPSGAKIAMINYSSSSGTYFPSVLTLNGYDITKSVYANIAELDPEIDELNEFKDDATNAINNANAQISSLNESQLEEYVTGDMSEIMTDSSSVVPTSTRKRSDKLPFNSSMYLAINHDDLAPSDYITTRKIYNKYGFNGSFNYIMKPFSSREAQNEMVSNVKKLIEDGNEIGLHSIMGTSFWWMNKLYDINPYFGFTFAPTLSDLTTDIGDGENAFGTVIDLTKPLSHYGFYNVPTEYASTPISEISASAYIGIIGAYTIRFSNAQTTGLDLDGTVQTWFNFKWLDYWYNELVDDSVGYSAVSAGVSTVFANDYEVPSGASAESYYPTATKLMNGQIVFYDDTTNPHYDDPDYQKVGRVKCGIFKGCASYCNYEIRDRLIVLAKAVFKHYFGTDEFTNFGRHGIGFVDCFWKENGIPYDNRTKTIISGEQGKVYNTKKQKWETGFDVLLGNGIKMTSHNTPLTPVMESQIGIYEGQKGIRSSFFNVADFVSYLSLMGNSQFFDGGSVSYNDYTAIMGDVSDPIKFTFENAYQQITKNGVTKYIHPYFRMAIETILACIDTGKIPVFSLDTITNDCSTSAVMQMLCQFCYDNDIQIVPYEVARRIAVSTPRQYKQNYFPNPKFSQILIDYFGESTSKRAYLPNGWAFRNYNSGVDLSVSESDGNRILNMEDSGVGSSYIQSSIYGLVGGQYRFSVTAKRTGNKSAICVYRVKNNSLYGGLTLLQKITPTSEYDDYSVEFTIDEPYRTAEVDSPAYQYSDGYQENTCKIVIIMGSDRVSGETGETISIYNPKLELI